MVTLLLDHAQLEIVLSPAERALTFHRGNIRVQRSSITKVQLIEDAWGWLRGVADPGTHIPGMLAMGTWKSVSGSDFVVLRRRRPGVVIDLRRNDTYKRLIVTTRHGLGLVQALRADLAERANVAELARAAAKGRRKPAAPRRRPDPGPDPTATPRPATA